MSNSNANDRKFPRKEIFLGMLYKYGNEWFSADVRDVTVGGMSFITSEQFAPGEEINVFFGDSNAIGSNDFNTEVLRSEVLESYSPPKYLVAVKLTEPNDKFVRDVEAFLKIQESETDKA